ncbi:VRR-NUC domain-containing protein [Novosphingobium rosa]|uniref:VRR-NUC domain-containing protein n=1 Tax=Novosphingobium rosa TaxID=76978 RepID=UPI000832A825|nr:VRR-NUC domain-containing protein [Novosphingobium rosa]
MSNPTEIQIQTAFRNRLRYAAPAVSVVAVPNAAKRGPAAIRQAKREGISSGFPDIMALWAGGLCFVEFKRPGGVVSENQAEWIERLTRWGHRACVCHSPEEALSFLAECGAPVTGGAHG